MLHSTQELAREQYFRGNKTQIEIADALDIHPKTLAYWISHNNWKEERDQAKKASGILRHNFYMQIIFLQEAILAREEGQNFPTMQEALIQCKFVSAIEKLPRLCQQEIDELLLNLLPAKEEASATPGILSQMDKKVSNDNENQQFEENDRDKKRINLDKNEDKNEEEKQADSGYIPKKNVVLRSGARWIENGTVYDPSLKANRMLRKQEYDELISKGLSKKDFQGWSPA